MSRALLGHRHSLSERLPGVRFNRPRQRGRFFRDRTTFGRKHRGPSGRDHRRGRHRPRGHRRGAEGRARRRASQLDTVDYDLGGRRYLATGEVLPDAVLDELRGFDAILLGAVGTPEVPPGVLERGLLLKMRFALDLYINLRPFKAGPEPAQRRRRLPRRAREHRRHVRGRRRVPPPRDAARDRDAGLGEHADGRGAVRALRVRARARRANASTSRSCTRRTCSRSPATSGSARSTKSRPSIPDVDTAYNHVDAACIYFVQDPGRYDVIVTDNLFGDILTDLGGAIGGGIGRAASANLNPARTGPSLFEPVHGSAPDIAGTGTGRPPGGRDFGRHDVRFPRVRREAAARIRKAVDTTDDEKARPRRSATRSPPPADVAARRKAPQMPITPTEKIWMNGELIPWADAQDPHPHALAALRHGRVRGRPRVRDRARARRCSV